MTSAPLVATASVHYLAIGVLGLVVLWTNTLLCVAAAWGDWRELAQTLGTLRWSRGRLSGESGGDAAFGELIVDQTGHARRGDRRVIDFQDDRVTARCFGGALDIDGSRIVVPAGEGEPRLWPGAIDRARAAAHADRSDFDTAYEAASREAGWTRAVRIPIPVGAEVWVAGDVESERPTVISALDPDAWMRARRRMTAGFSLLALGGCAAATWACTRPPLFGWPGIVGASAGLLLFLGVPTVGWYVRDALRPPDEARVDGAWAEPRDPEAQRLGSAPRSNRIVS